MTAPALRIVAATLLCLLSVRGTEAHALAQRYDLPLPLGFFLVGAGAAVAVSFVVLGLFWRIDGAQLDSADRPWMQGTIPRPIVDFCKAIGVALLLLTICAGLFGNQSTFKNIAPVAVWIVWWVGLSFVCDDRLPPGPLFFDACDRRAVHHSARIGSLRLRLGFIWHHPVQGRHRIGGCAFHLVSVVGHCDRSHHRSLGQSRDRICGARYRHCTPQPVRDAHAHDRLHDRYVSGFWRSLLSSSLSSSIHNKPLLLLTQSGHDRGCSSPQAEIRPQPREG